jgi:hypothetical protein
MNQPAVLLHAGRNALPAVAACLLVLLLCGCEAQPVPAPPREDAIPADAVKLNPETDAYPPVLHSADFLQPEPVPGAVNSAGAEDSAFVLPDGQTLYFWFTPDVRVPPERQVVDVVTGIYVSHRLGGTWSEAGRIALQKPGKVSLDGCVYVRGNEMWFCSVREGNYREIDMWTSRLVHSQWLDWKNAGELLNVAYQVGEMHITSDGNELYFHSDRPGGLGGRDIWMAERSGDSWSEPVNVSAVNSPDMDGWPFVTDDGSELWLTRTYLGTPALFRSFRTASGWSEPELIVSQFAGEASLDREGNLYFTHHFFRDGTMLEADIYVARPAS